MPLNGYESINFLRAKSNRRRRAKRAYKGGEAPLGRVAAKQKGGHEVPYFFINNDYFAAVVGVDYW